MMRYLPAAMLWFGLATASCQAFTTPSLKLLTAHCSLLTAQSPAIDGSKYAIIISGASGEESYAKQFAEWTTALNRALTGRFGFAADQVKVLEDKPASNAAARATADEVRRVFGTLRGAMKPESTIFVFFIGHGSFDGRQGKFNLVGPDLPAAAYNEMISNLPARRVVIFNMASASGEFIKPLAAKNRIIVTATRSGQEQNATRFTEHLIAALDNRAADADQNKRISVLEAFNYATKVTAEFYKSAGRLATEHALLEDNGDGVGHQTAEAGDGVLARTTYFDSLLVTSAGGNVEAAKLLTERTRLEEEIEQLKARKSAMPTTEYEAMLEKLLIELAKLNRKAGSRQ